MADHAIATIINFCTNDRRFIRACVKEAARFSERIIVPVCDHFFDGTPEDRPTLEAIYSAFPQCLFVEYPFVPSLIAAHRCIDAGHFWHSFSRWLGVRHLDPSIKTVCFLDADEVADGRRTRAWIDQVAAYHDQNAIKFASYWYFREPQFRATVFEESALFVRRAVLDDVILLLNEEREGIYQGVTPPKFRGIAGLDRQPLFHHYSWVRTEEEMLRKVRSWGHKGDRSWEDAVRAEFTHPFNGTDFVHGYSYQTVPVPPDLQPASMSFDPQGEPNVRRLPAEYVTEMAAPAVVALVRHYNSL